MLVILRVRKDVSRLYYLVSDGQVTGQSFTVRSTPCSSHSLQKQDDDADGNDAYLKTLKLDFVNLWVMLK